jgi:hypothetical protein
MRIVASIGPQSGFHLFWRMAIESKTDLTVNPFAKEPAAIPD